MIESTLMSMPSMAIRPRENERFEAERDSEGRFYAVAKNFTACFVIDILDYVTGIGNGAHT